MGFCFCCPCCVTKTKEEEKEKSRFRGAAHLCPPGIKAQVGSAGTKPGTAFQGCTETPAWLGHFIKVLYAHAFLCVAFYVFLGQSKTVFRFFFFFSNMTFFKPVCLKKKKIELSLSHGSSCPLTAACPLVLAHFSSMLHCYCFLFLQEIFLRIFKPTGLLPLDVILWYCKERAKRRAGVVRTVTTQCIPHFLLLAMMLQVQEQKRSCGEILHRFLLCLCRSRAPSWAPSPRELGDRKSVV